MANRVQRNNRNSQNRKDKVKKFPNKKAINKNKSRTKGGNKVQDARQKLMLKKRKGVADARDVLAKMAKTRDARSKLDTIRGGKVIVGSARSPNIKVIGSNIIRRTDRNGKISLSTKGGTNNPSTGNNNIKLAIQRELGLVSPPRAALNNRRLNQQQTVKRILPAALPPIVRKQQQPTVVTQYHYDDAYDATLSSLYKWTNPAASQLIGRVEQRPSRRNDLLNRTFENFSVSRALHPRTYIDLDAMEDDDIDMEVPPLRTAIHLQGTSRSTNIHSRLDAASLPQQESHGIFSQTKTKVVVPAGHRIVVSNLQSTVSQEDIKELFEDIGDLLAARLVRPGVAEVIYKNLKDAQKAVDTYHNRQLDGQPMKCLLVNKRPLNNPTAPALPKAEIEFEALQRKITTTEKLVPDISTIHKVLFQRK